MKDLFGQALLDFYHKKFKAPLLLHNEYGPPELILPDRFFEGEEQFDALENFALEHVHGKIIDIGAATGRHALYLQNHGEDVTAMDLSSALCMLMNELGIKKIVKKDIFLYSEQKYDTILMLMNGIGISGSIDRLEKLLLHLQKIISPGGQLIMDSTNIAYLYEDYPAPGHKYYGELTYRYAYKDNMGDPFQWLYVDQQTLIDVATATGWLCQIIFEDETDAYLARMQMQY